VDRPDQCDGRQQQQCRKWVLVRQALLWRQEGSEVGALMLAFEVAAIAPFKTPAFAARKPQP
jgi:hypothetical protein